MSPFSDAGNGDRDGTGTAIGDACAELRALGCQEGRPLPSGQTCYEHLLGLSAFLTVPAQCLRTATSQAEVRACGGPDTLTIRCRP